MSRAEWQRPRTPRRVRVRRAIGQTRLGYALKRLLRRRRAAASPPGPVPAPTPRSGELRNVLIVSHCDFTGNSALHVYSIASELPRHGFAPAIAVPEHAAGVRDLGEPSFPVLTYRDVRRGRLRFPDGRGPDLVHAFTPREHVRALTLALARPYVVHLEDNESAILTRGADPQGARAFLGGAAGLTVVIERLLELKPEPVPAVVAWPGFDERVLSPLRGRAEVRAALRLAADDVVLVYNGNVHESNLDEMRSLYAAVSLLRRDGRRAVLVKTGWNFVPTSRVGALGEALIDLGWVAREHVAELLGAADVLVQPGAPGPFDDYRFPSKLPEFLASGRPVVLPRTNIGLELRDGVEALLLQRGDAEEIAEKVALLAADAELREAVGARGREFALRELRWSRTVGRVVDLYLAAGLA